MYKFITYMYFFYIYVVIILSKLNKGEFMNIHKKQKIDMYMKKISYYSIYSDVLARILNEFTENGYENLRTNDIPNLTELLTK